MPSGDVNIWIGSDGDVNKGSNWSLGTVPVTGEHLVINAGEQDITDNLDALSAVALASFRITRGYSGSIGSHADDLVIDADQVDLNIASGSVVYLALLNVDRCNVQDCDDDGGLSIGVSTASDVARMAVHAGYVTLDDVTMDYLRTYADSHATLTSLASYTEWLHDGGDSESSADVDGAGTRIVVVGGTLTRLDGDDRLIQVVGPSATVSWQASGHTIARLECLRGTFTAEELTGGGTITDSELGRHGLMNLRTHDLPVTRTNETVVDGGTLTLNEGSIE